MAPELDDKQVLPEPDEAPVSSTAPTDEVETILTQRLIDGEFSTAKRNRQTEDDEFDSYIDLLDSVREPKQYEWMSDVRLPEFVSHVLTQASIDADQYFRTRDFVEVYLEDKSDEALASSAASKECINRTLNQRHLFYFHKYMRGKALNNLVGHVYALCNWEKKTKSVQTGSTKEYKPLDVDVQGQPLVDETMQERAYRAEEAPVYREVPVIDRFNFDIVDSRNVFTDNTYCYSLQQKKWVYVRDREHTVEELLQEQVEAGYYDLGRLFDIANPGETSVSKETYNNGRNAPQYEKEPSPVSPAFDIIHRFGKYWAVREDSEEDGYPKRVKPGIDRDGKVLPGAELIELIMTWAVSGSHKFLIRFQPQPYRDAASGEPYRPILRGLCYIHPVVDSGMGDGKHVRELQLALDDTFNISNDATMLATLPTLITKKFDAEENPDIYIEPGHKIPVEKPSEDLKWLEVPSNTGPALTQMQMLRNMMQQVDAIFPTTMGDVPGLASTTATAVAGAESRTDKRSNLKSMTFENTFLTDLYWMILQMTWQYAHPETGLKLMGDKVYSFNPTKDYFYKPLSSAIETEYSKSTKIKLWTQIFSQLVSIQHPDVVKLINYVLSRIFEYMGDEYANFGDKMLDPKKPIAPAGGTPEGMGPINPATNQSGVPQTGMEMMAREGANGQ